MNTSRITQLSIGLNVAVVTAFIGGAQAASIVNPSGTVALGVNAEGHLNAPDTYGFATNAGALGVTRIGLGDATAPGCLCEGWGVSASGVSAYANISTDGIVNITVDSFNTDDVGAGAGTFATSKVHATSLSHLSVTQAYAAAPGIAGDSLFQNTVTIENTSATETLTEVRYVRVMDWDVPPTEFAENVTILGTGTTTQLEKSHNDGFSTANPLGFTSPIDGATEDVDFTDVGPADHGAYFRFLFGDLAPGESQTFSIFYGAAANEAAALGALGEVGAELFSLGQNSTADFNDEETFIFGFKGVGGVVIVPDPTPDPTPEGVPDGGTTVAFFGLSLLGLRLWQSRLRRQK